MADKVLFEASTREGFAFKIMIEILQSNMQTGCFEFAEDGIHVCMTDDSCKILVKSFLERYNFDKYIFKFKKTKFVGVNLSLLYVALKYVKKKDSVSLFMTQDRPDDIGVRVHVNSKGEGRTITTFVRIHSKQVIDAQEPDGYTTPVIIPSNDYQSTCKELSSISNEINISMTEHSVSFSCADSGILHQTQCYGDKYDDPERFSDTFFSKQLNRVKKIGALSNNVKIFGCQGSPLKLSTFVSTLGTIDVYISTKEQIEEEELGI
jgi:hypothetical protein